MEVREQKQLIVLVDLEIFKEAKKRAVERGLTLKAWVVQALLERMAREDRAK